jgi:hypothetical protein
MLVLCYCRLTTPASRSPYEDGLNYIARLGYGFSAIKIQPVHVATGYWKQVFHLRLPNITEREPVLSPCLRAINSTECETACDEDCR